MNIDTLVNGALEECNKMVGGYELFVIEGNPQKNELRVLSVDEMYKNNLMVFVYGIEHNYIPLGIYTTREAAEESIYHYQNTYQR